MVQHMKYFTKKTNIHHEYNKNKNEIFILIKSMTETKRMNNNNNKQGEINDEYSIYKI